MIIFHHRKYKKKKNLLFKLNEVIRPTVFFIFFSFFSIYIWPVRRNQFNLSKSNNYPNNWRRQIIELCFIHLYCFWLQHSMRSIIDLLIEYFKEYWCFVYSFTQDQLHQQENYWNFCHDFVVYKVCPLNKT